MKWLWMGGRVICCWRFCWGGWGEVGFVPEAEVVIGKVDLFNAREKRHSPCARRTKITPQLSL